MTGADAEIARNIRREFSKRPVDSTRVDIQVSQGRVTLAGVVAHLRDQTGVSLEAEMELLERIITRERLVREVFNQVHYSRAHQHTHEEKTTRGRLRR